MDFKILGALHVSAADRQLHIGGPREQKILATLLLNANLVVSVDRLVDAVWDTCPPATSRNQIRNRVSQLRRTWASVEPRAAEAIVTEGPGYRIRMATTDLDATLFEKTVATANKAMQSGDSVAAAQLMRQGLARWRGPALSGIDGHAVRTAAERLDNRRLTVLENCLACELELGWHTQILDELTWLATEHPFRERLVLHLMSALYRSGRRADALAVYRRTVALFREELGVDPGVELRQLHEAILRGQPASTCHTETEPDPGHTCHPLVRPAELPADIVDFTGRTAELQRLDQSLPATTAARQTAVPILAITGTAGVGKTALAVRWAHLASRHYPDGQLFLDLRGRTPRPLEPLEALVSLLRSLGAPAAQSPADIDNDVDTGSRLFRSLSSGKRILLLLDDVATAEQVRPLLPGSAGSLVVLTGRGNLAGLAASHGARLLPLDVLGGGEAVDLLAKMVGEDRVATDPQATAELARGCAYLPLALRTAAATVCGDTRCTIRDCVDDLRLSS